ncbi:transcription elongation factor TFIIS-like [Triticum dicoccoides]|uniref:transcription elongation factor TFIIS-like n=1 Tax=Triticum dicoccoides TaxID=85692 RepID=UPI0018914C67|nr:transcription elongation factor TFIIS-like [Triticum dicoccoides]
MASPPGPGSANRALSSSRGPLSPFPGGAGPFLRHQHPPGGDSDGGASFDEDDDDDDEEEEDGEDQDAELAARSSQQRRAASPARIGRPVVNGENGGSQIQEGQQWQLYSCGTEQHDRASSRGDEEPGSVPREMRVEDGYGVIGRREGGPASSYWDLLRAHLSDPLTGILMDDAMILSCGHSYGSSGMQHIYRMKACGKCGQPITENSIRPNLALGLAVQAFRREEESAKTLKRKRDRLEQGFDSIPPAAAAACRMAMERELMETFEAAKKAAAAAAEEADGSSPEAERCLDALRRLREFRVNTDVLVSTQVGKRLRYLTKHPNSDIQAVAADLFGYWKKVVIEETGKKNGTPANGKSNNSAAKAEKPQPMKVERKSANVKVEKNSTSTTVKTEKNATVKTEKDSMSASVKIEKTVNSDSKVQVKVEKVSKEVSRTSETKKPSSVPNGPPKLTSLVRCNDAARDKYRELLVDAFVKVSKETSDDDREEIRDLLDQVNACDPYRVAVTVESALFERIGRSTGTHKVKYRSILFNLKADNNPDFRRRVLLGEVRPGSLVDMPADEMASDARKLENQQIKEKALFDCERASAPKASTDQFKCGRCGQRKTTYYQLQTRSADEPMTTFVTCVNCNNHWKFC